MMKNEEAITCIKMMFAFWANAHELNVAQMEAAKDLSIAALGNGGFIETRKMVPLTLEQLRGMKKVTPVWWEGVGFWCLAQSGGIVTPFGQCYDVEGLPGEFYSYPPAQIDWEAWTAEWVIDEYGHKCSKCGEYSPSGDYGITPQFCPSCGRATTPDALAELEKRFGGT